MDIEVSKSQETSYSKAGIEWDLPKLYADLAIINHKGLSRNSKLFLQGILLGFSPSEIAQSCNYKGKDPSNVVRVVLARNVYPSICLLLNLSENYKMRWDLVPRLLSEYKLHREEKSEIKLCIQNKIFSNRNDLSRNKYRSEILNNLINKYFMKRGFTEDFLGHNIKAMDFRNDWQFIVNKLVGETKEILRAMVLDVELRKWWSSLAGTTYMATNIELLKKGVTIKRIFILNSSDFRVRSNALMSAYLHNEIGIDVRILDNCDLKSKIFYDADMISIHDNDFIALYYLSEDSGTTNLILNSSSIASFSLFYDDIFRDDTLCKRVDEIITREDVEPSFLSEIHRQVCLLEKMSSMQSVSELIKIL